MGCIPAPFSLEPQTVAPQAGVSTHAAPALPLVPRPGRSQIDWRLTPEGSHATSQTRAMGSCPEEMSQQPRRGRRAPRGLLATFLRRPAMLSLPQGREGRNHSPRKLLPRRWLRHSPDGFCPPRRPSVPVACLGHWTSDDTRSELLPGSGGGRRPWSSACSTSHGPGGYGTRNCSAASTSAGPCTLQEHGL